ncbi:hypothetical protein B0H10DRAFT_2431259 [Mycena sp. CBHHK59/15]|nr:hypothetical protein B0H10DRAFT_2431259 [Mycena sp. CBHHK59/15]
MHRAGIYSKGYNAKLYTETGQYRLARRHSRDRHADTTRLARGRTTNADAVRAVVCRGLGRPARFYSLSPDHSTLGKANAQVYYTARYVRTGRLTHNAADAALAGNGNWRCRARSGWLADVAPRRLDGEWTGLTRTIAPVGGAQRHHQPLLQYPTSRQGWALGRAQSNSLSRMLASPAIHSAAHFPFWWSLPVARMLPGLPGTMSRSSAARGDACQSWNSLFGRPAKAPSTSLPPAFQLDIWTSPEPFHGPWMRTAARSSAPDLSTRSFNLALSSGASCGLSHPISPLHAFGAQRPTPCSLYDIRHSREPPPTTNSNIALAGGAQCRPSFVDATFGLPANCASTLPCSPPLERSVWTPFGD